MDRVPPLQQPRNRMYETYRNLAASLGVAFGLPNEQELVRVGGESHEGSLRMVLDETGVVLDTCRVRVGVGRGHLLEVVFQVPLDVSGGEESMQLAAEAYLEGRLGTAVLDEWVGSVAVDRIARTSGLLVVSDSRSSAPSHPLSEGVHLVRRGIDGIRSSLPESLLRAPQSQQDWTALEIPPTESGLQSDRCFASTRFPEALKCALEGMPFRSSRFTRGPERLVWLSWEGRGELPERLRLREEVEGRLLAVQDAGPLLVAGTGFGRTRDYVDVWLDPAWGELRQTVTAIAAETGEIELGFYDTPWSEHPLRVRAAGAPGAC